MLNVTTTDAVAPGFVTVWPGSITQPVVSNLNVSAANQIVPNAAIVGVRDQRVNFYLQAGGHLIADVAGWYT
jgi:hypothetical protein